MNDMPVDHRIWREEHADQSFMSAYRVWLSRLLAVCSTSLEENSNCLILQEIVQGAGKRAAVEALPMIPAEDLLRVYLFLPNFTASFIGNIFYVTKKAPFKNRQHRLVFASKQHYLHYASLRPRSQDPKVPYGAVKRYDDSYHLKAEDCLSLIQDELNKLNS